MTLPETAAHGRRTTGQVAFVGLLGLFVGVYVIALGLANPDFTSDFDQVWAGARALLQGRDPYAIVGPGREFG
jgi:hypothetical protein